LYNLQVLLPLEENIAARGPLTYLNMADPIQIHTVTSQPFDENSYIVWRSRRNDALVVDPGFEPDPILEFLDERGLELVAILNTHGHADHIAGNQAMKAAFPEAALVVGAGDAIMLTDAVLNLSAPFGLPIVSPAADRLVKTGDVVDYAGIELQVQEIPGHSPGHVIYLLREQPPIVLGGDVLFRNSIGRGDFPGGSTQLLIDGIRRHLFELAGDTIVYPGHGPATTIAYEKRTNPFVGEPAGHFDE
jgi:glyoxylase-like metal-dependent hydrolase (beta-lactamase superfamily II)